VSSDERTEACQEAEDESDDDPFDHTQYSVVIFKITMSPLAVKVFFMIPARSITSSLEIAGSTLHLGQ